jgi:hypothetical protein
MLIPELWLLTFDRCEDGRAIVTLDLDFAKPLRFPPALHHGIAVLRGPVRMHL